jgi:hypothetical protein
MNAKSALYRQSKFPNKGKIDTIAAKPEYQKANDVLMEAHQLWNSLDSFRKQAKRNKEYIFKDQWADKIQVDGKWISERQHIINQGNVPMQNNRIRGTIRTVVSLFSSNHTEPVCVVRDDQEQGLGDVMSASIQYVYQVNEIEHIDPLQLTYLLGTGLVAYRAEWGNVGDSGLQDVVISDVNYNDIFFDNTMTDPRHWDCKMVGQIHSWGLRDIQGRFAKTREQADYIANIYRGAEERLGSYLDSVIDDQKYNQSFFIPNGENGGKCRVIEVWRIEAKERFRVVDRLKGELYKVEIEDEASLIAENEKRTIEQTEMGVRPENLKLLEYSWFVDNYWHFWYLSPYGDVLLSGETPYEHKSHPYSFLVTPFYDGQVFPFVNDFIDQQRILNRYIITQDFITRHSAKGALMIHKDALGTQRIEDIASEYTKVGGVFLFEGKPGTPIPQTIMSNVTNAGMYEMINLQLKMFEDISGVQGALQGQAPNSGTPASLFAQQVQNSATSLTEVFNSFKHVRKKLAVKTMKLIQQFYDTPRYINLVGQDGRNIFYDPKKIQSAEIDLAITESPSSPTYRMMINEDLRKLNEQGQITLEEMLQASSMPYKDKLLNLVKQRQQAGQPINAEQVMQEAQQ